MRRWLTILALILLAASPADAEWAGNHVPGQIVDGTFVTVDSTGALAALSSGAADCYKDNSTTQSTSGVTLTTNFDTTPTGQHHLRVDTSADSTFYSGGSMFTCRLSAGTVGGVAVTGYPIFRFALLRTPTQSPVVVSGVVVVADATGVILQIPVKSTSGTPVTGLVFDAAGLAAEFSRPDQGNNPATAITLTGTCTLGTYTSGCLKLKDATAGIYELHPPATAWATGADRGVITLSGAAGMVPTIIPYEIVSVGMANVATTLDDVNADTTAILGHTGTTGVPPTGTYRKNVGSQPKVPVWIFLGAADYTGDATTVTIEMNKDDGGWSTVCAAPCASITGGGTAGKGLFWYLPSQADTNCNHCIFRATAASEAAIGRVNLRTAP